MIIHWNGGRRFSDDVSLLSRTGEKTRVDWQKMVGSAEVHSFSSLTAVSSDRWIILTILEPTGLGSLVILRARWFPSSGGYQSSSSRHG